MVIRGLFLYYNGAMASYICMKKQEILNGISSELEGLSSETPRELSCAVDCYADNYDEDSIGALIYKWEQLGFGDFKKKFPITSRLYVQLVNMNNGIERPREEYAAIISLAKDALAEIQNYRVLD